MANLTRYKQKIFANNSDQVGVFGTGTDKVASKNVETLQSADYEDGWSSAIITSKNYPVWQERDGVDYGFSYQLAYLLQKGIPDWLSTETYYQNDYCKVGNVIYYSLEDNNVGHNPSNTSGYWSVFASSSRNIGEIVTSTIPLTDAGLHLLDGTLISGDGSYAQFVDYIADLYDSGDYTAIFDTEANWQSTVTSKGICNKFVYDSVNNTVRLPKYGASIYTKNPTISISTASTVPVSVYGTGKTLGLTDGSSNLGLQIGSSSTSYYWLTAGTGASGTNAGTSSGAYLSSEKTLGVNTNSSRSGLTGSANTSGVISSYSLTNYPLGCYYYIVIATTTKTDIEVDIDEIATDLNNKADITAVDGRWVFSNSQIAQSVTYPTSANTAYSLANYLPDDNYSYEVMLSGSITTGTGSSDYLYLTVSSDIITSGVFICGARTRTTYSVAGSGNAILPVGGERKIYINYNSGYTGTYNLYVKAYRRLGNNT